MIFPRSSKLLSWVVYIAVQYIFGVCEIYHQSSSWPTDYLHSCLGEIKPQGQLLPGEHVRMRKNIYENKEQEKPLLNTFVKNNMKTGPSKSFRFWLMFLEF